MKTAAGLVGERRGRGAGWIGRETKNVLFGDEISLLADLRRQSLPVMIYQRDYFQCVIDEDGALTPARALSITIPALRVDTENILLTNTGIITFCVSRRRSKM